MFFRVLYEQYIVTLSSGLKGVYEARARVLRGVQPHDHFAGTSRGFKTNPKASSAIPRTSLVPFDLRAIVACTIP